VFEEYTDSATVSAFGLYIDNERVAAVNTRQDINFALETLEAQHLALTGESAHIANRLDVRYGEYATDEIISRTALIKLLSASNTQDNTTAKLLASSKTMTASADSFSLPEQDETQGTVLISYETVSHETVREYVDFSTRYVEDDALYKGQTRISTYGHRGLANVTYEVTSVDGEESGRTKVSSTPIYEPVTQVVRIGTKALPETMTEENNGGKFMILPLTNYFITDRYGYRVLNGRSGFHYGLDLAAYYGTEIYAAASGEVIYAGYSSSYGYHVKIEHENGIVTLYAHCSKLLVKEGDTVSQGEVIAEVGNTGYSYGAHCHLEVIVDGQKVNPEDYIYTEE
jgi:murein DD-endopeptidase MepM/ murein hydrolase activator NlpD